MTDKGALVLNEKADLARCVVVAENGWSSIHRGPVVLYPVQNIAGNLYFSRKPLGDNAEGNTPVLVDWR